MTVGGGRPPERGLVRRAVTVGIATGAYGVSFGALSVAAGFSTLQTVALSSLLFTGGSQFAIAGIAGGGGSAGAAVAASTLLGVRNGLYGLEVSRVVPEHGWRRLIAAHVTIDESTAMALAQHRPASARTAFWATGIAVFAMWNLLTLAGALLGNRMGDPRAWGLDAAAAAAFVALLWPRLQSADARATGVLAALIALTLAPFAPAGVPILIAGAAAVGVGLVHRGRDRP